MSEINDGTTWRARADALAAASNMWRAHAEALAEALDECKELFSAIRGDWSDPRAECRAGWAVIDTALARLPAEALAKRQALEALVNACRDLLRAVVRVPAVLAAIDDAGEGPIWDRACALMTLWDAARGEGGA